MIIVKIKQNNGKPTLKDLETWRKVFEKSLKDPDFKIFTSYNSTIEIINTKENEMTTETKVEVETTEQTKTTKAPRKSRFDSVKMLEKTAKLLMKHVEHHGETLTTTSELRATSQELRDVLLLREDLREGQLPVDGRLEVLA